MISFDSSGNLLLRDDLSRETCRFIDEITAYSRLPDFVLTDNFLEYLWHREQAVI